MNYILAADLHIRSNRPQFRKDDYFKSVCRKFRQIIYLCNKYEADLIVAGDFFDHIKVGHKVVNTILGYIKKLNGKILVVAGQHDQVYHTEDLKSSPLFTLLLSGKVMLLQRRDPYFDRKNNLYGCSFGQEPIVPKTENNILVIHKPITPEEPPFFLNNALSAEQALDNWPGYFLIISGDYHHPFTAQKWGNVLINCGPMMRQSIDQMDIEPRVWLYDTQKEKTRAIKLKIQPVEEVFLIDEIKNIDSKISENLDDFISVLMNKSENPDYEQTVDMMMNEMKISDATRNKVLDIIKEAKNE